MKKLEKLTVEMINAEEDALIDFQFAILAAMQERGMTQVELAEALGVSRARVSQLLSSEANPTLKIVGRALDCLGLKTQYAPKKAHGGRVELQLDHLEEEVESWRRVERRPKIVANDDWPSFQTDARKAVAA